MKAGTDMGPAIFVAGRAATLMLAPLALVLLPQVLGEAGYGKYSYWFGLISIYLIILDMGVQPMLRRYLPELLPRSQGRPLLLAGLRLKLIPIPLFVLIVVLSPTPLITASLALSALVAALAINLADIYYCSQHMLWYVATAFGRRLLRLVFVPVGFILFGMNGIIGGLVLAEVAALVVAIPAARLLTGPTAPLAEPFRRYFKLGLSTFGAALLGVLLGRLPVIAAEQSNLTADAVGRIALSVDLTYFALKELVNAVSESILPRLVIHNSSGRTANLQRLIELNFRVVNMVALGIVAVGTGLTNPFLSLLGPGFSAGALALYILLPSVVFMGWNMIHNQLLFVSEDGRLIIVNQALGILSTLVAITAFWPSPTIEELAGSLTLGTAVAALTSSRQTRSLVRRGDVINCFLRLLPGGIIATSVLLVWPPEGWITFALAGSLTILIYSVCAVLFGGLPSGDRRLLKGAVVQ
jgi:O-antigen/teichoic acid export membrane protein